MKDLLREMVRRTKEVDQLKARIVTIAAHEYAVTFPEITQGGLIAPFQVIMPNVPYRITRALFGIMPLNNQSNSVFYTFTLEGVNATYNSAVAPYTFDTKGMVGNTYYRTEAVDITMSTAHLAYLRIVSNPTGSPGNYRLSAHIFYRFDV
jgi:hypothetical protein